MMMLTSIKSVVIKAHFAVFNPQFCKGHSGSDIGPLTSKLIVKAGLKPIRNVILITIMRQ
jgi:hypothetical protein